MNLNKIVKPYIYKYKWKFALFFCLGIIVWISSMVIPYLTGTFIDSLLGQKSYEIIYVYTALLAIIMTFDTVLKYACNILLLHLQNKMSFDMNIDFIEHIKKLPIMFLQSSKSAYLSQRVQGDCNSIISFAVNNSFNIVINILTLLVTTVILFVINLKLAIILVILIPIYIKVYFMFKKPLYEIGYELKESQNQFFSSVNDQYINIGLIKVNAIYNLVNSQLTDEFSRLFNILLKYGKVSFKFSTCDKVINDVASVIIFFVGGYQILNNLITVGEYLMISNYFSMLLKCTSFFMNFGKSYQDAMVSFGRLQEIKGMKSEKNGCNRISSIESIEIKNLFFSYDEQKNILNGFNYKFMKGNTYCIIGENGTGKSTFINVLIGLYNGFYRGDILYNSMRIEELDMYHIRHKLIGVSEQEPTLINSTLLDNLTYGLDTQNKEQIMYWCDRFDLFHSLKEDGRGLELDIYENNSNISGGEKQKISLIRLLLKDPDVLILDEPTSAFDFISIETFKSVIDEIKKDKVIFMITHNQELMEISDEVINSKDFI
ncbi:ABC transporter transmembrane domain-containing protein [Lacrimispora aerotolerans]|uniref:ABC transporter transmembrane domain-containing protein n=1 Tax=Lacrimispora aerotolerans TaxID=36832 RepID=UPI00047A2DC2|nr:ABC transporter ATP-binding protein [Lacrimispora aerotolerans]